MTQKYTLKDVVSGWVDNVEEFPENKSAQGLQEYAEGGCNYFIGDVVAYLILREYEAWQAKEDGNWSLNADLFYAVVDTLAEK